jgi:D-glycero-beta-D-manno-heptose 1-phosphate adenylyltransferase
MSSSVIHDGGHQPPGPDPLRLRATRILKASVAHYITFKDRYISDHDELKKILKDLQSQGCTIVFTCGVWDLFHIGHGDYIQKGRDEAARLFPDSQYIIMVVGVDTDALTKERKGPQRPIVPEDERCKVLGHLRSVDIITPQTVLNQLYEVVSPHVLIVSTSTKDLPPDLEVARRFCAHVVSLPPQSETTTTARVRKLTLDGGLDAIKRIREKMARFFEEIRHDLES